MLPLKTSFVELWQLAQKMVGPSPSILPYLGRVGESLEDEVLLSPGRHWSARHVSNQGERSGSQAP